MQSMALRERYAVENLEVMRQSQEETRRLRHEMRHHLALLSEMLSQKQEERAGEYVRSLLAQVEALPSANYSDNMVINAIAGYYLNAARTEGVRVETDIRPEKTLPLKDEELCVLLTNLLENALEACRRMDREQDRFLSVRIVSGGEHLLIDCENSTHVQAAVGPDGTVPTSKSDEKSHGFGLPAIRAIVEKHGGQLAISCENGCFRAQVTL
jgi:sensor histidine kinase regulating citrate/malate metabolism